VLENPLLGDDVGPGGTRSLVCFSRAGCLDGNRGGGGPRLGQLKGE
jgi:hypothetical protein